MFNNLERIMETATNPNCGDPCSTLLIETATHQHDMLRESVSEMGKDFVAWIKKLFGKLEDMINKFFYNNIAINKAVIAQYKSIKKDFDLSKIESGEFVLANGKTLINGDIKPPTGFDEVSKVVNDKLDTRFKEKPDFKPDTYNINLILLALFREDKRNAISDIGAVLGKDAILRSIYVDGERNTAQNYSVDEIKDVIGRADKMIEILNNSGKMQKEFKKLADSYLKESKKENLTSEQLHALRQKSLVYNRVIPNMVIILSNFCRDGIKDATKLMKHFNK